MPRRVDEPFAVTVTMTARERDLLLALMRQTGCTSMMSLVRMLVWQAADEEGLAPAAGDFERPAWGDAAHFRLCQRA